MRAQDNRDVVGMITVPLTYFYADPGSLFSPKLADWYRDHAAAPFKAVRFPGSDHLLVTNDPDRFTKSVAQLMDQPPVKAEERSGPAGEAEEEVTMTLPEAIDARHSVRAYKAEPIPDGIRSRLDAFVRESNKEGDLHISICYDDPAGFDSRLAHYGSFRNVQNYIVLAGKKDDDFNFRCGYFGEKVVLFAQQLGLNTCWTALTFNKKRVKEIVAPGDALCMAIALGYGETQGSSRKSKSVKDVTSAEAGQ